MHGAEWRHGVAGPIDTPLSKICRICRLLLPAQRVTIIGGAVCAADMQDAVNSRHRSVIQLCGIINCVQDVGTLVAAQL
jgi:hypothetical protein